MHWLIQQLGKLIGLYFVPDNHVLPVFWLGRYHRVGGPGFVWIWPILERTLPPVKTGLHVGNFYFGEILSKDNIPFNMQLTVLFTFKPAEALPQAAAQLVKAGPDLLEIIVKDYANQGLRRLAARYEAEALGGSEAMATIEHRLTEVLTRQLKGLGLAPLPRDGILIKETIAPEKFKRGMLNARRLEAMLQTLTRYPMGSSLIQQAIQAGFVTGLEDLDGDLMFVPPMEGVYPAYSAAELGRTNQRNGKMG
jgi:hypothetical protein